MTLRRTPLKRGTSVLKRTPLKAGTKRLKTTKRLPFRSKKTAKVYREERVPLVKDLFADNPTCVYPGCNQLATDPHEIKSRARGGSITDPANVVPICREHHTRVTDNPLEAEALRLSIHSWETV